MALTAKMTVKLAATLTSVLDLNTAKDALDYEKVFSWTTGTGANQGDMLFHDQRTLSASATEAFDLSGSLSNAFGTTQAFIRLNTIIIFAASANTNNVNVQRASSNGVPLFLAASDGVAIPPGGMFLFNAGDDATDIVVAAGAADILTITNSSGSTAVTYDVILLGATA